jgi:hypothetical protein
MLNLFTWIGVSLVSSWRHFRCILDDESMRWFGYIIDESIRRLDTEAIVLITAVYSIKWR